jgi:proteasome accessory factor A
MTAVQLQLEYFEQARKYVDDRLGADVDRQTADVLARWESVLGRLETDPPRWPASSTGSPSSSCSRATATARGSTGTRRSCTWSTCSTPTSARTRGLYNRLVARGRMERIVSDAEVERAVVEPPEDTRAYFRGRCLSRFPSQVAAASWDSVIFDVGRESLQRVPTLEPLRGTRAHVGALIDRCADAVELVEALSGRR